LGDRRIVGCHPIPATAGPGNCGSRQLRVGPWKNFLGFYYFYFISALYKKGKIINFILRIIDLKR